MDNTTYTITLYDNTVIDNLTLNGNNYISQEDVGEDNFTVDNLHQITITQKDENGDIISTTEYTNMKCTNYWQDTDGWHIVLHELTSQELLAIDINAKLDYIAMMTDIDLDE